MTARRIRVIAAFVGVAGAAAIAAAGVLVAADGGASQEATTAPVDEADSRPIAGAPAPRLEGVDPVTGERVELRRGKPLFLTVWASWCEDCPAGAQALARFAARHSEAAVVGIDYQDTAAGAKAAYRDWGWRHPSIADSDGQLASRLGVSTIPTTFVYNRRLRLVTRLEGPQSVRRLEAALRRARRSA
jgi:thiol-disulfide isomerase/thioredoxin